MLLLVFSTRCCLQILIITRTNEDMSHFARVGIFNSGLRMTNFSLRRLTLKGCLWKMAICSSVEAPSLIASISSEIMLSSYSFHSLKAKPPNTIECFLLETKKSVVKISLNRVDSGSSSSLNSIHCVKSKFSG